MTSCFLSCTVNSFQKGGGVFSLKKEFAPVGANSFVEELTPFEKGGRNKNGRIASPESVPIYLNW